MSAHVAVPHTMPGRVLSVLADDVVVALQFSAVFWSRVRPVLAVVWRVLWPTLAAIAVGFDIVVGGLVLSQAGHQDWAMVLVYGSFLAAVTVVAWILADGEG